MTHNLKQIRQIYVEYEAFKTGHFYYGVNSHELNATLKKFADMLKTQYDGYDELKLKLFQSLMKSDITCPIVVIDHCGPIANAKSTHTYGGEIKCIKNTYNISICAPSESKFMIQFGVEGSGILIPSEIFADKSGCVISYALCTYLCQNPDFSKYIVCLKEVRDSKDWVEFEYHLSNLLQTFRYDAIRQRVNQKDIRELLTEYDVDAGYYETFEMQMFNAELQKLLRYLVHNFDAKNAQTQSSEPQELAAAAGDSS